MSNYWDCALLWVSCQSLGLHINLKFPGRGQRDAPVGDIYVVVELSVLLPGRRGGLARSEAARLLVRCYGGDPALAEQVIRNRERQEQLARQAPQHPMRAFGEAIEAPGANGSDVVATRVVEREEGVWGKEEATLWSCSSRAATWRARRSARFRLAATIRQLT